MSSPLNVEEMLAKNYDPRLFEKRIYAFWQQGNYFAPSDDTTQSPFVVVIPPPNVTGVLHMGHGLNGSLQDVLVRYHRMKGRPTLWVPGTDHAGIATQHVVEKELREEGLRRTDLGREAFLERTWQVKERHHAIISEQLRQLGSSCDWERERFTMDEGLSTAVREVFVRLYQDDLIYRGEYLVNWCGRCGTALADDEVEHTEEQSFLYEVHYPLTKGNATLTVATSRPETLFGDVALAVHPEDPRYQQFIGQSVTIPLSGRTIPIIADSYVDREFGSAVLKVTPAHDPNDFEIGNRHNLPRVNILTSDGKLNDQVPPAFQGLPIKEARTAVITALTAAGAMGKQTPITHRVGHCYRCDTTIEPYLSLQWFVRMAPLATDALQAHAEGKVQFYPKRWENTYTHWLNNIRDWCISRQLWWGHRIPVWYCQECEHLHVSLTTVTVCEKCASAQLKQDEDVLDTWFSSWLWPFSTLGWPAQTTDLARFYPTSTLVTAYDIIFFWVARMIMAGLKFMGEVPFKEVYITPLVRDKQGRKMSKSLGNGIDPLAIINTDGADALRFTMVYLSSQGQDLPLDTDTFKLGSRFANKIWNATRYLLMNLDGLVQQPSCSLIAVDNWIYARLNHCVWAVDKAMAEYRFDDMGHAVYDYFWSDFCDWYIEAIKLSFMSNDQAERQRAGNVALQILEESLRLLHPFLPFITEELYQKLPYKSAVALITAAYPTVQTARSNHPDEEAFMALQAVVGSVRAMRTQYTISPEKKVRLALRFDDGYAHKAFVQAHEALLLALTKASSVDFTNNDDLSEAVQAPSDGYTVYLFARDFIDVAAEREKIGREQIKLKQTIEAVDKKLNNPNFMSKANPEAVAKEQSKREQAMNTLNKLAEQWAALEKEG